MSELKSCPNPKCLGEAKVNPHDGGHSISCRKCDFEDEFFKDRNCDYSGESLVLAKAAWNTRTSPEGGEVANLVISLRDIAVLLDNHYDENESIDVDKIADTIQSQQAEIDFLEMAIVNAKDTHQELQARYILVDDIGMDLLSKNKALQPYKDELLKIAESLGEGSDPFAAWEGVAALQARVKELEGVSQWQPIETYSESDGRVNVYRDGQVGTARFGKYQQCFSQDLPQYIEGWMYDGNDFWIQVPQIPTLYMPLPPKPGKKAEELTPNPSAANEDGGECVPVDCMVCKKEITDYVPEMCCSGHECGCMGMPTNPPICSHECWDKAFKTEPLPPKPED